MKFRTLFTALFFGIFLGACSTYSVSHRETAADGTAYHTRLFELVPPGGKKISDGSARIGVGTDGEWEILLGAKVDTDATGTAIWLDAMLKQIVALSGEMALLRTMIHPKAETGPPTPEITPAPMPHAPMDNNILNR